MTDTPNAGLEGLVARKFRKRPVEIEAVQLDGSEAAWNAAIRFVGGASGGFNGALNDTHQDKSWLYIDTLEGQMTAKNGDWIVRGVKGEFYPCKPDIFALTYEGAPQPGAEGDAKDAVELLIARYRTLHFTSNIRQGANTYYANVMADMEVDLIRRELTALASRRELGGVAL